MLMHIDRIQVEEGFLDGLDVQLKPGLNVLIGARGTGKTSIIELVRYCLNAPSSSIELGRRSREHALSILGPGQVTVTLSSGDGSNRVVVSRTAEDESPRGNFPYQIPIVFSQTEIETVGLSSAGRLQLIDAFISLHSRGDSGQPLIAEIRSLTAEIAQEAEHADRIAQEVNQIDGILERLLTLAPEEARIATLSADAVTKKNRLDLLSDALAKNSVKQDYTRRFMASVQQFAQEVDGVTRGFRLDPWQATLGTDPLLDERNTLLAAANIVRSQVAGLAEIHGKAERILEQSQATRVPLEEESRVLRSEIEGLEKGAGAIARETQNLRQKKAQLEETARVLDSRQGQLRQLIARRAQSMEALERDREARFLRRMATVTNLNKSLGPRIRISIERSGQFERFSSSIAEALKGSGLRYNDLAPVLAQRLSPRELVEAVDQDDTKPISDAAGINAERALRIILALKVSDLGAIATVDVEDDVRLELLDGPHYKDISELSTGQRCTVILPIVLAHLDRIVVVDQPEDHIDNAFITDTLIKSIAARGNSGQMLFSTHNANIPVLGNAEHVIQMASDGRRGFAAISATLADNEVVEAISKVMEGGREAFQRRADFYDGADVFD